MDKPIWHFGEWCVFKNGRSVYDSEDKSWREDVGFLIDELNKLEKIIKDKENED